LPEVTTEGYWPAGTTAGPYRQVATTTFGANWPATAPRQQPTAATTTRPGATTLAG